MVRPLRLLAALAMGVALATTTGATTIAMPPPPTTIENQEDRRPLAEEAQRSRAAVELFRSGERNFIPDPDIIGDVATPPQARQVPDRPVPAVPRAGVGVVASLLLGLVGGWSVGAPPWPAGPPRPVDAYASRLPPPDPVGPHWNRFNLRRARMPAARPTSHTVPAVGDGGSRSVRLPGSFEHFYLQEYPRVVKLAYALSGSRAAAEDIAQEAFLRAYRDWDRVGSYEHQAAWVRRVAANLATSGLRRRLVEARALARLAARREPSLDPLPAENADFWRAVRALPHRQAQAVALYYLEDLSIQQTAAVLDCAQGTVRAHLARARRTLARRLGLDAGEEP